MEHRPYALENVVAFSDYGDFFPRVHHTRLEGANVVATKDGLESTDTVMVVAHHDTVRDSPGADDNTASVAGLVELARLLAPAEFRRTVMLAAVDMEEIGFFGSRRLVEELVAERAVVAAVVFETMSFTARKPGSQDIPPGLGALYPWQVRRIRSRGSVGDFTAVMYRGDSASLAARFAAALEQLAGTLATVLLRDPLDIRLLGPVLGRTAPFIANFSRSDHIAFWERRIPAINVNDTANFRNPNYHQATDTPDTLDYNRLADIVAATAVLLENVAGRVIAA